MTCARAGCDARHDNNSDYCLAHWLLASFESRRPALDRAEPAVCVRCCHEIGGTVEHTEDGPACAGGCTT
jgi:hypothetical protein